MAREGELSTVETDAGRVRALAPEAEAVQVTVRADAVTLHAPDEAPPEAATSARNRFAGQVVAIDTGAVVARVLVDVGAESPLAALVTMASVENLTLCEGAEVVVSFKATATRASPQEQ